jgi:hypothetical protein
LVIIALYTFIILHETHQLICLLSYSCSFNIIIWKMEEIFTLNSSRPLHMSERSSW